MIISCNNCDKKFEIDENLIPEKGRLLECSSCKHQWFFKKENIKESQEIINIDKVKNENKIFNEEKNRKDVYTEKVYSEDTSEPSIDIVETNIPYNDIILENKKINTFNILNYTIVFIISFLALILLLDTFKNPLGKIIPNLEFLLYNLYETIKDIILFIKNLI